MNEMVAVAYLVLSFPGEPHAVVTLPMNDAALCEAQRASIDAAYYDLSQRTTRVFAHCVKTGFPQELN